MPDPARLRAAARGLFPAGVALATADPRHLYPLLPGEALPAATPARLREFSAGRHAARAALSELGHSAVPLLPGADRAPVWPAGVCGSITHSRTACLAAVSLTAKALGLDVEEDTPLEADLWDTVLLPEERAWAIQQPDAGRAAKLVFSAKEAAYKAQYRLTGRLFDFHMLRLDVGPTGFAATFRQEVGPFARGQTLSGRHIRSEGHVLTAVSL